MKRISWEDYGSLKSFFKCQPYGLCSYSLPSLIVWSNHVFQTSYALENGRVIIANHCRHRPEDSHLLLPLLPEGLPAPEELAALMVQTGYHRYESVPEDYLERVGWDRISRYFAVTAHPEYDDYVYLTDDLSRLKGNRYARKRNLLHQFDRDYLAAGRVAAGAITPAVVPECLVCLEKWCAIKKCDVDQDLDMACEKKAAINALLHLDKLEMRSLFIRIDGEVCAFCISSHLGPDMGVMNFEKALPHIRGLYQYLDNECAKTLFPGYRYINKESDMGLPALAESKNSYHPVRKIRAYRLECK